MDAGDGLVHQAEIDVLAHIDRRFEEAQLRQEIDIALLDINMNGQMAYPVADELLSRGIPFIFLSGYGTAALPEAYRNTPRIPKPYDPGMLMKEIRRLIG